VVPACPEGIWGQLEHHEFLAADANDARREFTTSLSRALGESGSIAVYNAAFESGRLSELAAWLPEFADQIKEIQARLWGLASSHSEPRLPSRIRRVVFLEGGAAGTRA
jgi:hypothetical protein